MKKERVIRISNYTYFFLGALDETNGSPPSDASLLSDQLSPKQRHQMKHRELFLSRQVVYNIV